MSVTAYAASGSLSLSAFRTTVVGASDSVSMSKLAARNFTTSTATTDIQYYGTNVPWAAGYGTNNSIPERTTADPTPTISISDLHGAIPWFETARQNQWHFSAYVYSPDGKNTSYGTKLTWDNVVVYSAESGYGTPTAIPTSLTTGGYTYYRTGSSTYISGLGVYMHKIGRD